MFDRRFLIRLMSIAHRGIYRATGGRIGGKAKGPVLLLTTKGRRSGRPRTVPLLYIRVNQGVDETDAGGAWAVVGSYAGEHRHPAWWLNLRAEAEGKIQIGSAELAVTTREAGDGERAHLWPRFVSMYPGYEEYRQRTRRRIPVVILERQ
jgi:deazaflavin-dependent oxidoreductase (nitroreductase family)